ncbi:MAG: hypothetical protein DRI24_23360 [Deltaproteobacteria bacterium]|nr:MAG: hypothetical protein DRI24_23360 [Deltaproteobacteria bacterium]
MEKYVIYGSPGTGKTTYLMGLLEKAMDKTPSERIAFVSFTRQGTYEGVERAIKKFKLNKRDTQYFKTIHSLCFHKLGINRSMMISKEHYKLLSEQTGIAFTGYYTQDMTSQSDVYLHYISMLHHNPKVAEQMNKDLNATTLAYVQFQYAELKKQIGILDFDDLLLQYLEFGEPLDIDVAFIDEAQDLTPLQWRVVNKLFLNCSKIWVSGDDDQAVYEWSGANIAEFMSFSTNSHVLGQSYRLPKNVLRLAMNITKDIKHRKHKDFKPKDTDGKLSAVESLETANLKGGELVLARTNWVLKQMSDGFSHMGLPYLHKGRSSLNPIKLRAIYEHLKFEQGIITADNMSKFKTHFRHMDRVPWQNSIILSAQQVVHYDNVLLQGNIDKSPVLFDTFHSCKGSENDHVIVNPELSTRVYKNMFKNHDSELRCLYVAMTRTKSDLTVLLPKSKYYYPSRYFS